MSGPYGETSQEQIRIYTRQHPRYATSIFIRAEAEGCMCECRGNVSLGGFCIEHANALEAGERVELLFRLPGAGFWLRGSGRVLASEPRRAGYAVRGRFESFDSGDPELLRRWTEALARFQPTMARPAPAAGDDPNEITLFSTVIDA